MNDETPDAVTRCGFAAVLGAPNAGKSTLVNALVGAKVSIVTPKAQTTRTLVRGIAMFGPSQVIFVDTPGIFRPRKRFERAMVAAAWAGAKDSELVLVVVDAERAGKGVDTDADIDGIVGDLKTANRTALLILNKIDAVGKEHLLPLIAKFGASGVFTEIFMVSALTGDGLAHLKEKLAALVPPGPWMFPDDEVSDMPIRMLAAEITREKLFLNLMQELPYSCAVDTENWQEKPDGSVRIDQTIYITRDSHKPIVLGEGGKRIKAVGASARHELEGMLDRKVHLFLHVKVNENWREQRGFYSQWGLDFDA